MQISPIQYILQRAKSEITNGNNKALLITALAIATILLLGAVLAVCRLIGIIPTIVWTLGLGILVVAIAVRSSQITPPQPISTSRSEDGDGTTTPPEHVVEEGSFSQASPMTKFMINNPTLAGLACASRLVTGGSIESRHLEVLTSIKKGLNLGEGD